MPVLCAAELALDDLVTTASGCFETLPVENADVAPAVTDQISLLQGAGGLGHGDPQYAQHAAQQLLRQTKVIRSHAVARHQEPAGEAGFDQVKTVAGGGLRDLNNPFVDVAVDLSPQGHAP